MPKFKTSLHLKPDVAEARIDVIGRAVLIEQARLAKLTVTGEVERIYDELVVGVAVPGPDGTPAINHVPIGSPLAGGRTVPDARVVEWQADVEPITADPAPSVIGQIGADGISRALVPGAVVEQGGMVAFKHNLGSNDVLVTAYAADGTPATYEFAIEISPNEQQVLLLAGASHIQAVIDDEDTE